MKSFLARSTLLLMLTLTVLQGALISDVKSKSNPRSLPDSGAFGSRESAGSHLPESAKSRQKRCTCYSYTDKECVYYCHLDIIWINTPEHTVPYGMSSYRGQQRRRRAAGRASEGDWLKARRCVCVVADADPECQDFCLQR
uniref:Endothelin-3 n=1 Tax=Nothobranchius furzeri TaxID=105023 RepID=A0A8C6Q2R5_NOTFU